jgi:hypothetical protein
MAWAYTYANAIVPAPVRRVKVFLGKTGLNFRNFPWRPLRGEVYNC